MRRIFFASTVLFSVFTLVLIRLSTRELVPSHEQQYTMYELIKLNENSKILYDRYVLLNQQLKRYENVTEELFASQQREKLRTAVNESFWQNEITPANRGVLEAAFLNNVSISVPFVYRNNNGCSPTTTANFCLHLNFLLSFAHNRTNCSIVIAIPTVKRDSKNYLFATLENLLMKSQPAELADTIIIVSIGETDIEFILKTTNELLERFPSEIESGLIEVIAPTKQFYPSFENVYETFNDKIDRVRWRTKQVFDFIFLMAYGYQKAPFYLQLEDDIVAKDSFISVIKEFISIKSASNPDWFYSEFCKLGFIGKLFQSSKLIDLSLFFYIFNNDKPVDWLLMDFVEVKYCSREKKKDCDKQLKKHILKYPKSLFQHTGTESSLHGKKQKAKDRSFGKIKLNYSHQNPIANVSTSLTAYNFYTLNALYLGNNFFWAHEPKLNDEIRFNFKSESGIVLKHFQFRSGHAENQKDLIVQSQAVVEYRMFNQTSYQHIGTFNKYGIANYTFNSYLKSVTSLRIRFLVNFDHWVVLSEIHIEDQQL